MAIGLLAGFPPWLVRFLEYLAAAAVTGAIAAARNRNVWAQGFLFPGLAVIILLLFLPPLCGECLSRVPKARRLDETCPVCGRKRVSRYA